MEFIELLVILELFNHGLAVFAFLPGIMIILRLFYVFAQDYLKKCEKSDKIILRSNF